MTPIVKITRKQAQKLLDVSFPDYTGRKINLEFKISLTFYDTNWSGGTHTDYRFLKNDGSLASLPNPAPWVNPYEGLTVELPIDILVVSHVYFCGSDMGIRIYSNPLNAPKFLTA